MVHIKKVSHSTGLRPISEAENNINKILIVLRLRSIVFFINFIERFNFLVYQAGIEPAKPKAMVFETIVSTNFTTGTFIFYTTNIR